MNPRIQPWIFFQQYKVHMTLSFTPPIAYSTAGHGVDTVAKTYAYQGPDYHKWWGSAL